MTTKAIKKKRTRVTQKDIERARHELTRAKESSPVKTKPEKERPKWGKDSWHGSVYCDSYGHAWIDNFEPVYLGKTDEIVPYLKGKEINGENVDMVLQAAKFFWSEKDFHSCH